MHCTYNVHHILLMHLPVDGHLGRFYLRTIVNDAAVHMAYKYLFKPLLWILLGTYSEMQSWGRMVTVFQCL